MTTATVLAPWFNRVAQWFDDRNLTTGSNPQKQYGKLLEELAELYQASNAGDVEGVKDAIGDASVVMAGCMHQLDGVWPALSETPPPKSMPHCLNELIEAVAKIPRMDSWRHAETFGFPCLSIRILLSQVAIEHGLTLEQCEEHAWGEIRHRTGKMIDGVFVKDA
ncbi:MAG: hypothetical protein AAGJ40_09485 [Planctomycetota bacterium]